MPHHASETPAERRKRERAEQKARERAEREEQRAARANAIAQMRAQGNGTHGW